MCFKQSQSWQDVAELAVELLSCPRVDAILVKAVLVLVWGITHPRYRYAERIAVQKSLTILPGTPVAVAARPPLYASQRVHSGNRKA